MPGDLRYILRTLLRSPRFAATAALVLALGIGANSSVFAVVYAVLLRPLPYADPSRIAVLLNASEQGGGTQPATPGDFEDYRAQSRSFERMAAASLWSPTLTGDDRAEQLSGLRASASLFEVLGIRPAYGRLFDAGDEAAGGPAIVVLTYGLFERRFGGDPAIVGRTITLDGKAYTVAGVTPRGFYFPPFWAPKTEVYTPAVFRPDGDGRGPGYLRIFARLKHRVSLEQARAELRIIAARLAREYPRSNAGVTARLTPIHEMTTGDIRPVLLVLLGAVGCTLLIACANVANLLVARAYQRRKEIAIRRSLGAERFHLVRQFVLESTLLSAAGGAAGLILAWWAIPLFVATVPDLGRFQLPRRGEIGVTGAVFTFNAAICLATALFCGLITAFHASRADLNADLKQSGRGQVATRHGRRLRNALATAEIAIALLLLTGAGLLVESYRNLRAIDPGFDPKGVVAVNVGLAASGHRDPDRRAQFYREALEQLRSLPGAAAASAVNHVPLVGDQFGTTLTIEGQPLPAPGRSPKAVYRVAFPGYFETMRMRLLEGRDFTARDAEDAPGVAVVNATAAKAFWPGQDPIGKRIRQGDAQATGPWLSVAGVIADVKQWNWSDPAEPEIYLPFAQDADYRHNPASFLTMTLVVRAPDTAGLAGLIRERIAQIDRNISIPNVLTMDRAIEDLTWQPRTSMGVVLSFAVVALLLASVGIYGVVSFIVAGRTQEIGVRMALGARRRDVLAMIVRESLAPVVAGVGIGLAAAFALTRLMSSMLFGVRATDPAVFGGVALGLAAIALVASLVPARRASRLDPLAALRHEG
jgi:predicted permease